MIHYSCDCCKRMLEPGELRYVVHMDVHAAIEPPMTCEADDDRDHLQEIQDILQQAEDDELPAESCEDRHYDLCAECHKKFLKNPLGRDAAKQFDFSNN